MGQRGQRSEPGAGAGQSQTQVPLKASHTMCRAALLCFALLVWGLPLTIKVLLPRPMSQSHTQSQAIEERRGEAEPWTWHHQRHLILHSSSISTPHIKDEI